MGYKYTGDATISTSLTVTTPKPLDCRTVVNTVNDLYTIPKSSAYEGMLVANINNGNIYVLVDVENIDNKLGWKASYETILIIACTELEYNEWSANTSEDFSPIDPETGYIHQDTYYYIYEDSIEDKSLKYLSYEFGLLLEESLKSKASNDALTNFQKEVRDNYVKTVTLTDLYYNKSNIDEKFLTLELALNTYATKETVESILTDLEENYVTKDDLRGDSPGSEDDDFIFVTLTQYNKDKASLAESFLSNNIISEVSKTLLLNILKIENNEVSLEEPVVSSSVTLTTDNNNLLVNSKQIALLEELPLLECLTLDDYDSKVEEGSVDPDTYYFTYGETSLVDTGYVTPEYLKLGYYTKSEVDALIKEAIELAKSELSSVLAPLGMASVQDDILNFT